MDTEQMYFILYTLTFQEVLNGKSLDIEVKIKSPETQLTSTELQHVIESETKKRLLTHKFSGATYNGFEDYYEPE